MTDAKPDDLVTAALALLRGAPPKQEGGEPKIEPPGPATAAAAPAPPGEDPAELEALVDKLIAEMGGIVEAKRAADRNATVTAALAAAGVIDAKQALDLLTVRDQLAFDEQGAPQLKVGAEVLALNADSLARVLGAHHLKARGLPGSGAPPPAPVSGALDWERAKSDPEHYRAHRQEILGRVGGRQGGGS